MRLFQLSDFLPKDKIVKNGIFSTIGSAKNTNKEATLCYALDFKYLKYAEENPNISAIITHPDLKYDGKKAFALDEEPDIIYGLILNKLILKDVIKPNMAYSVSKSAIIHPSAFISEKSYIGNNVIIGRNVIINDYTIIEDNCIIGDNVVLGCEGFYFKRKKNKELMKFLHSGGVHLHKNVEVMTGSIIQKAHDAEFTTIEEGTKISVNVNIGHSCKIGKHNMITGNIQIAGRVTIGDNCWIGTSSTISDSIVIGNNASIKIGSVVVKDVKDGEEVSGNFAYNHLKRVRNFAKQQRS